MTEPSFDTLTIHGRLASTLLFGAESPQAHGNVLTSVSLKSNLYPSTCSSASRKLAPSASSGSSHLEHHSQRYHNTKANNFSTNLLVAQLLSFFHCCRTTFVSSPIPPSPPGTLAIPLFHTYGHPHHPPLSGISHTLDLYCDGSIVRRATFGPRARS